MIANALLIENDFFTLRLVVFSIIFPNAILSVQANKNRAFVVLSGFLSLLKGVRDARLRRRRLAE
jgi:hypothetical protein